MGTVSLKFPARYGDSETAAAHWACGCWSTAAVLCGGLAGG
jgi:hypothetical protein